MALQVAGKLQGRADLFRKIVFTKIKSSKIKSLDYHLRGSDNFFSVFFAWQDKFSIF